MGPRSKPVFVLLATCLVSPMPAQSLVTAGSYHNGSPAGDVNGDGRADWIEVSPPLGGSGTWMVHDGATGAVLPHLTRTWVSSNRYFAVGDVDGDGCDDLCHYAGGTFLSTIHSGVDASTLLTLPTSFVEGGADVDGDGRNDLLLSTFLASQVDTWIRSSRTGTSLFTRSWSPTGSVFYNWTVCGDENGDGYDDAALLAESSALPGEKSLSAVVRGPNGTTSPIGIVGALPCGDVDGDGKVDIGVSADGGVTPVAYILAGGSHAPIWTLSGPGSVAGVGDIDGDGRADLAGTALTTVHSGATQSPLPGLAPTAVPLVLGDVDGDGRSECHIGGIGYEWNDPALPISSRMLRRGVPGTTSSGRRPKIVTRGHCGLGNTVWFDLRGNEPNSAVLFAVGDAADADLAPFGAPGNRSYTTLAGISVLMADGNGVVVLPVVMPNAPALLGAGVSVQSATFDPPANVFGVVTSNAIDLETQN